MEAQLTSTCILDFTKTDTYLGVKDAFYGFD